MKRICSLLLALCMIPAMCLPAFAAKECHCGHAPMIYVHGFGKAVYQFGEDAAEQIYPPTDEKFKETTKTIVYAALALVFRQYRLFATLGMRAAENLLGKIKCDPNGNPLENTGVYGGLPKSDVHGKMQIGIADYSFSYDWRLSPVDNAQSLREYILRVCTLTGHSKVSLVCHSMGGTVLAAYLYQYGGADIEQMICLAPAWQGLSIMGSLLSGEAQVKDKSKEVDLFLHSLPMIEDARLQKLMDIAGKLNLYKPILRLVQHALDSQFERVYYTCLRGMFATMPGMWAFVPDGYYERAKAFTFGDDTSFDALIDKIDFYHYNIQNRLTDLLSAAMDDGMQLFIVSGYGISSMPLSSTHTVQSDILIDTVYTSIGAVSMPFDKKLPASHKQVVPDEHNHISPDGFIDASACAFPENTWFVRGMMHFDYPTDAKPFVLWAIAQQPGTTVHTDPQFPQFIAWDKETGLSPVE